MNYVYFGIQFAFTCDCYYGRPYILNVKYGLCRSLNNCLWYCYENLTMELVSLFIEKNTFSTIAINF
jgi:hypothetical protein